VEHGAEHDTLTRNKKHDDQASQIGRYHGMDKWSAPEFPNHKHPRHGNVSIVPSDISTQRHVEFSKCLQLTSDASDLQDSTVG